MSDFPYVAPPADGLRLAMADARGRRYRSAGLSSATVGTALVAVLALLGGTGTQSLVQQPAPEQPAVTQLVPGPDGDRTSRQNTVGAVTAPGVRHRAQTGQGSVTQVLLHNTTGGEASTSGSGQAAGKPYAAGRLTRNDNGVYVPQDPSCNVTGKAEDATTLCPAAYVYGPYSPPTAPYQLNGQVCSTRTGTTTLHYAGRNEVDMTVVSKTGKVVWRWSQWHPDGGIAHTLGISTGACSSWTYDWTGVDASGQALPKGDYSLTVTFLAAELSGRNRSTYAFTIN
jgi:hypothetical protein